MILLCVNCDVLKISAFSLFGLLHRYGYTGRIGFQGYGIGGDVFTYLQRSMNAFRSMEKRLSLHPNWGKLI